MSKSKGGVSPGKGFYSLDWKTAFANDNELKIKRMAYDQFRPCYSPDVRELASKIG